MTLSDLANGQPLSDPEEIPVLVYVLGCSCAGKSTLLDHYRKKHTSTSGFVEVGKYFRNKYPAGHFEGQASPTKTREEAIRVYKELTEGELSKPGLEIIFVDGQPSSEDQVEAILGSFPNIPKVFILLDAPQSVRLQRAEKRHPNRHNDGKEYDAFYLAKERITSTDYKANYITLVSLLNRGQVVKVIDSNHPEEIYLDTAELQISTAVEYAKVIRR